MYGLPPLKRHVDVQRTAWCPNWKLEINRRKHEDAWGRIWFSSNPRQHNFERYIGSSTWGSPSMFTAWFPDVGGTCIGWYWATCMSRKRPPYSLFKLHHSQRNVGLCRRSIFYTYLWLCASKMSRLEPEGMKFHIVTHIPKTWDSVGCILLYTSRCSNKNSTPKVPLHTPLLFPLSFMIKSERLQVRRNRPVVFLW